jgi:hypothetical protein
VNPLGIIQAALLFIEGIVHAANPKRRKETKWEKIRFLSLYCALMLACIAVLIWTIHSLYFSR